MDSTSDDRVNNNTVRHQYRTLTDAEKTRMLRVKDIGQGLLEAIADCGEGREYSLAKTKVEEAVMWAVKGITK